MVVRKRILYYMYSIFQPYVKDQKPKKNDYQYMLCAPGICPTRPYYSSATDFYAARRVQNATSLATDPYLASRIL